MLTEPFQFFQVQQISLPTESCAPVIENHIAHATAVFCELSLAFSAAAWFDPLRWRQKERNRHRQWEKNPIQREQVRMLLQSLGVEVRFLLKIGLSAKWNEIRFWLFPIISSTPAYVALFALAGILDLKPEVTFLWSVVAFALSMTLPLIFLKGSPLARANSKLDQKLENFDSFPKSTEGSKDTDSVRSGSQASPGPPRDGELISPPRTMAP